METTTPYIILRVDEDGKASTVKDNDKLKDATYWLNYIAEPGDALFITDKHPKYQGEGEPTYRAHLAKRGQVEYDKGKWLKMLGKEENSIELP